MMALTALALAGCLSVASGSDQIHAGDLAAELPEMAALAADLAIAPAPIPGVVRVFHPAELRRLAAMHGLAAAPDRDICVARPVAALEPSRLTDAMRREFPKASIELLEWSRQPAPEGVVEFARNGLRAAPSISGAGALWMGTIRYGGNHRFSIWARVKIAITARRVVALRDLEPGSPILPEQVEFVERQEFPATTSAQAFAASIEDVIGRWPRQTIRTGQPIRAVWLEAARAVNRGDTVRVAVHSGATRVEFEAHAENSGAVGDTIYVRNPDSKRRFRARVEAPGSVAVDGSTNAVKELNP
jgi:flagella basal body P-ring formation protein FlgA